VNRRAAPATNQERASPTENAGPAAAVRPARREPVAARRLAMRPPPVVEAALASESSALEPDVRQRMEGVFGQDLSSVRLHTGPRAAESARAVDAQAFAVGNDLVFGQGRYAPETAAGTHVLAHELAHVVAERAPAGRGELWMHDDPTAEAAADRAADAALAGARAPDDAARAAPAPGGGGVRVVRRYQAGFDPAVRASWEWAGRRSHREQFPEEYAATLAAVPGAAIEVRERMVASGPPATDEARDVFERRVRTLIRLNALGMMASHRAAITNKREETFEAGSEAVRHREEVITGQPAGAPPTRFQTQAVIRTAAEKVVALRDINARLADSRFELEMVEGSIINVGIDDEVLMDRLYRMRDSIQPYKTQSAMDRWNAGIEELEKAGYPSRMVAPLWKLAGDLVRWRQTQITGVNLSIAKIYEAFPFMTLLDAERIRGGPLSTTDALMAAVREAYDDLLEKVDVAITKIGSGNIDPYDLPEAIETTRLRLPPDQRTALDQILHAHQIVEFYKTMGLSVAQIALVFIPVVGPLLAASLGLAQVGAHLEELLDRVALSEASTQPDQRMLGVGAPGMFEWAMFGVEVLMTAFDMRGALHELGEGAARVGTKAAGEGVAEHERMPEHVEGERPPGHVEEEGGAPKSAKTAEREAKLPPEERAWEERLNSDTRRLLDDEERAALWHEMDPRVRKVLTHCSDYCIPPNATKPQAAKLKAIVDKLDESEHEALRDFLYSRRGDLGDAIKELEELGTPDRMSRWMKWSRETEIERPRLPRGQKAVEGDVIEYATKAKGLERHEVMQNAWLETNKYITERLKGPASRRNPTIALTHEQHEVVGMYQRQLELFEAERLKTMTYDEVLAWNALALRHAGVPQEVIEELLDRAQDHWLFGLTHKP
jgi:hypothetical protein